MKVRAEFLTCENVCGDGYCEYGSQKCNDPGEKCGRQRGNAVYGLSAVGLKMYGKDIEKIQIPHSVKGVLAYKVLNHFYPQCCGQGALTPDRDGIDGLTKRPRRCQMDESTFASWNGLCAYQDD